MRIRSTALPLPAALLLAAASTAYAGNWMLTQTWERVNVVSTAIQLYLNSIPAVFLLIAFAVLFQRLRDRNAWLMAVMFCGFTSVLSSAAAQASPLGGFVVAYRLTFLNLVPGTFGFFFLVFPDRSPIDRRAPWLKWLLLGMGALLAVSAGPWRPLLGQTVSISMATETILSGWLADARTLGSLGYFFLGMGTGLMSLVWSGARCDSVHDRRKARVLAWGTVAGTVPVLAIVSLEVVVGDLPGWVEAIAALAFPLIPLSFAYAVVKHRVMTVPVLVQRGARYLLVQRGLTMASGALSVAVAVVLALLAQRWLPAGSDVGLPVAVIAAGLLGVGVARTGARVERRITDRIDRAFFPERYEARRALEELAARTRTAEDRGTLASMLRTMLRSAFRPVSLAVYLEDREGRLVDANLTEGPGTLSRSAAGLAELASEARPAILPPPGTDRTADDLHRLLGPLQPECLAPLIDRNERLVGLVVLGGRQSEEPYSGEDMRLLAVVSLQSALTVQTICLGEEMATRIEAERRAEHEVEIAKEVQRQLLPARAPERAGFASAGECIQAKSVGGDYYDFVELEADRVGFVLADVSGKGIAAALLMANLQATLRSQYTGPRKDPARLLEDVNRLFFASTPGNRYATLFLAEFNPATRELRYVNCGHVPPVLARSSGSIETLAPTATVIGLFEEWIGTSEIVLLEPGDTLVVCSDGVTEALNDDEEEYGEDRLRDAVAERHGLPVPELLTRLQASVQQFAGVVQSDDLTLLVARSMPSPVAAADAAATGARTGTLPKSQ